MPVPRNNTTSIESVAITFLVLVASICIPVIMYISQQQETQQDRETAEDIAASAAEVAIQIRRHLDGRNDEDNTIS